MGESKLTLHGLLQYYVKLTEKEKNRKLNDLLDALEFNQVVIFVKSVQRAIALDEESISSVSTLSSITTCPRIATATCTVLVAQAASAQRAWLLPLCPQMRIKRC